MAFGILVTFAGKIGKENFISFAKDSIACKESKGRKASMEYLNRKALKESLLNEIKEELRKRGYSEEAIAKILRWYQ